MFGFWKKHSGESNRQQRTPQSYTAKNSSEYSPTDDGQSCYEVVASALTDVGCQRDANEDSVRFVRPGDYEMRARKGVLAIIADGMGGHSAGDVASKMAVEIVARVYYEVEDCIGSALVRAFNEANRLIYEASLTDNRLHGMGTTCTALVLQNGSALCAHVGDSRIYLLRNSEFYQMTQDQSAVMELVRQGIISLEEARNHEDKNVILSAMGSNPEVEVATWPETFPVRGGDRFLLCSDGLHDLVNDNEMKDAIVRGDPHFACQSLVALAKQRGGYDNISVAILSIGTVAQAASSEIRQTRDIGMAT